MQNNTKTHKLLITTSSFKAIALNEEYTPDLCLKGLEFEKNLCHICDHLVNKFAVFKAVCLDRSLNNERFYDSKSLKLQIENVNLFTICSEIECKNNDSKRQLTLEIKYDEHVLEHTKEDNNPMLNESDVEPEDNFLEDNYESPAFTRSIDDSIKNTINEQLDVIDTLKEEVTAPKCIENKKVKIKKKRSFTKIILTYDEQKAVLERQRRDKKYLDAVFKCHSCALGFLFKDSYQSHMVRHEESNGQYCCDVCSLRFATQNLKYMHMILHTERYRCNKCEQTIKRTHKRRHMNECWHGCRNAVSCQSCTKVFKDPDALHQHIKRFHTTELVKTYSCNVCGQTYNNQRAVRTHMIKHVNHRFECDICQSTFASPYTLQRHKKAHTQPDPAYCATCDKWYKSKRLYREHLTVSMKHRQYRFGCPVCGRACPSRRALAAHTAAAHASDKPYTCACANRFATARALAEHERRHRPRRSIFIYGTTITPNSSLVGSSAGNKIEKGAEIRIENKITDVKDAGIHCVPAGGTIIHKTETTLMLTLKSAKDKSGHAVENSTLFYD
ncbi:Zinc finger protein 555 [Eumeta japonica]|uniref:Zinc finger protein 555 n=1 Tax=Eumeta variegata TaxID=151549 RepID=A0A4C1Z132_EUMVA|nr:Zinc finger protein 555 [Eumeta japonica]